MDFRQIAISSLIQVHSAKLHPTSWRLDPPSNAIASRGHALAVRLVGRMRVQRIPRIEPLSDDIFEISRSRGRFETLALRNGFVEFKRRTSSHIEMWAPFHTP